MYETTVCLSVVMSAGDQAVSVFRAHVCLLEGCCVYGVSPSTEQALKIAGNQVQSVFLIRTCTLSGRVTNTIHHRIIALSRLCVCFVCVFNRSEKVQRRDGWKGEGYKG